MNTVPANTVHFKPQNQADEKNTPKLSLASPTKPTKVEMIRVILRADIPIGSRALWAYILDRQGRNDSAWPSIGTIASDLKLGKNRVKRAIYGLEDVGIVRVERTNGDVNHYVARNPFELFDEEGFWLPGPKENGVVPP